MRILIIIFNWIIISSVAATFLTVIILFIKFITKNKQSAEWHYYVWFILVVRLLIPYAPDSSISIFNTVTPVVEKISAHGSNLIIEPAANIEPINIFITQSNSTDNKSSKQYIDIEADKAANTFN